MNRRRPHVLIIDDEDNIVLALHRVLHQDNHRYDVLLAKSAEVAQEILRDIQIDVMITDVHLPDKSGMDLLCWAAVESPQTKAIVMTAFDITGIKDRAHAFGCLRLTRKPFDVHEMRATIHAALDHRDGIGGNLGELSLLDVIQMLCISRKTTAVRVSEGQNSGVILIENGEVVHAVWNQMIGEEAFFEMIAVKEGVFNTSLVPPDAERTIKGGWQYLLMEGIRRHDEAAAGIAPPRTTEIPRASQKPPEGKPTAKVMVPSPKKLSGVEVARLIDQGFSALKRGDHEEAQRCWEEGLRADPSNRMLELNLRKLQAKLTSR